MRMDFKKLHEYVISRGDSRACAPIAIASHTRLHIQEVLDAAEDIGRVNGRGMIMPDIFELCFKLGYDIIPVDNYIGKTPSTFKYKYDCIVVLRDHIVSYKNGIIDDHSPNSRQRIKRVFKLVERSI